MAPSELERGAAPRPTAAGLASRIKANVGMPWLEKTVDGFVAGNPETQATGIAVVMMASLPALEEAVRRGLNVVITHEPTYWDHHDDASTLRGDALYKIKTDFIEKNDLAVFHFHDHWHRRKPDGIAYGLARKLGWVGRQTSSDFLSFSFPGKGLGDLADELASKLGACAVRAIGDRGMKAERVMTSWGFMSRDPGIALLANPEVDVVLAGETHEWEAVEYALDASAAGMRKGLVVLGHVASERAGMEYCAEWLRELISEVPVEYVEQPEPYWLAAR